MKHNVKIHCLNNLNEISFRAFEIFSKIHNQSDNRFYIVPGGNTPVKFFNILANNIDEWSSTQFILSDERIVDDKSKSNDAMFERELLGKIKKDVKPILLRYTKCGNQSAIDKIFKIQKPKLAILGLGLDGHTASLFPGNPEIFNKNDDVFFKINNEWEDFYRISLSFSSIMNADKILFLVNGKEKAKALKKCLNSESSPIQYPAQFIFHNYKKDIYVLCDESAGKYLS